ncbi:uncharacterized mitochondrial protein AtMg00810-like [Rutidosis leptorrhynchoides]|uniref:uncharacterized mitochondrial protein AtMg00810-like n=1 Tax=Rutidosis leptorrhynchoides TaxID=125765 RepID=UPI003A99EE51
MKNKFEMSMLEELHFFLGLEVKQLPKGIFIGQSKYISDMFKKFNFPEMKISPTPMSINISLHADLDGQSFDQTLYRSLIGSLMYLTASRPDIMFDVCLCALFQANPRYSHYKAVMRIFRHVQSRTLLQAVAPKYCGCSPNYLTMDSDSTKSRSTATLRVPLLSLAILFTTLEPNTLIFAITLLKIMLRKGMLNCILYPPKVNLLTY